MHTHTIIAAGQAGEGHACPEALGTGVVGRCTQRQGAGAPHSLGLALPSPKWPEAANGLWPRNHPGFPKDPLQVVLVGIWLWR